MLILKRIWLINDPDAPIRCRQNIDKMVSTHALQKIAAKVEWKQKP